MFKDTNKKIVCTIEARMGSSRLPGKVLLPLAGVPSLKRMWDRIKKSKYIDEIVIATTENQEDRSIVEFAESYGIKYFCGSEQDVLKRVHDAAENFHGDVIVELTGDCPLIDYRHIDRVIELYFSGDYEYASNIEERSFPDGFDVQVFSLNTLKRVASETDDPIDRVHVTYYILRNKHLFRTINWKAEGEMYWPTLGLTLDEKDDYFLIDKLFDLLLKVDENFSAEEIVNMMKRNPELIAINEHIKRKKPEEG
ncbi:cytidylyltransferase domain-containing protein [Leptospira yasudae]|uniref:cytidylyltransferase domain-containing protein n=1 Tax=Leptospira yasudae TaxID=2202201 RepID=UPI0010917C0C|nr:glycosyltransferase family protein [Leptospira yasudae]TGM95402.1 spore coat biosynthesis protein F [Leptospira yasudae]